MLGPSGDIRYTEIHSYIPPIVRYSYRMRAFFPFFSYFVYFSSILYKPLYILYILFLFTVRKFFINSLYLPYIFLGNYCNILQHLTTLIYEPIRKKYGKFTVPYMVSKYYSIYYVYTIIFKPRFCRISDTIRSVFPTPSGLYILRIYRNFRRRTGK